jgi:hypothetical protein
VRTVDECKSSDNISVVVVSFDHVPANTAPMLGSGFIDTLKVHPEHFRNRDS